MLKVTWDSPSENLLVKVDKEELLPKRANPTDAGLDLRTKNTRWLDKGVRTLVDTGVRVKIPAGFVGLLVPRSSLSKNYIQMTNSIGIIDSDYRGNIMASLMYTGPEENGIAIPENERIVQLVVVPCILAGVELSTESDQEWNDTTRGTGGFGSTGTN